MLPKVGLATNTILQEIFDTASPVSTFKQIYICLYDMEQSSFSANSNVTKSMLSNHMNWASHDNVDKDSLETLLLAEEEAQLWHVPHIELSLETSCFFKIQKLKLE